MDIKFLFYAFLCVIAFIFVVRFGNKKFVLIKEKKYYHKLLKLKLSTRILIIILAWIFSVTWIIIAYKYDYKGISILGMLPFVLVCSEVDYVSPMMYPSHYGKGVYGLAVPDANPYKTIYQSTKDSINRNNNIDSPAIIRP